MSTAEVEDHIHHYILGLGIPTWCLGEASDKSNIKDVERRAAEGHCCCWKIVLDPASSDYSLKPEDEDLGLRRAEGAFIDMRGGNEDTRRGRGRLWWLLFSR